MTNTKYTFSPGCSICGTKNSTSQFRPWHEHYPEDVYCMVFRLTSLAGRRGKVCNPCVLYIRRAYESIKHPSKEQQLYPTDHTKRLDCKLKGKKREETEDLLPPDAVGPVQPVVKESGYFARNMRICPRYVFTGKKYIPIRSKYQLIPAGPWRDPKEFLEDEDGAERDLPFYRSVTLKKGVKTIEEKAMEKKLKDMEENERLFGEIPDDCSNSETKNNKNKKSSATADAKNSCGKKRTYETRLRSITINSLNGFTEKINKEILENFNSFNEEPKETDEEHVSDCSDDAKTGKEYFQSTSHEHSNASSPSTVTDENSGFSCDFPQKCPSKKRKFPCMTDDEEPRLKHRLLSADDDENSNIKTTISSDSPSYSAYKKSRRVMKSPERNLKVRNISFFDMTYWQKFPICCRDVFVGEGGMVVQRPYKNFLGKCSTCRGKPLSAENLMRMKEWYRRPTGLPTARASFRVTEEINSSKDESDSGREELSKMIFREEADSNRGMETCSIMSSGDDELIDVGERGSSPMIDSVIN